jgi:uncharacterized protein YegP (UPF0339 family)
MLVLYFQSFMAKKAKDKWEFYQDNAEKWRWRRTASKGEIVGASSQGYASKASCIENAKRNGYT